MAKSNKIFKIEHRDSFVTEEIGEEEWENLQPRVKAKYKVVSEKTAAPTPNEAKPAASNN